MARCERGYLCEVCGDEVEEITGSDLYLRFVLGEVPARALLTTPERHLRCNPFLAQFICDERFPAVTCSGPFDKHAMEPGEVQRLERRVTRAFRRLHEVRELGLAISDYPLPDHVLDAEDEGAAETAELRNQPSAG